VKFREALHVLRKGLSSTHVLPAERGGEDVHLVPPDVDTGGRGPHRHDVHAGVALLPAGARSGRRGSGDDCEEEEGSRGKGSRHRAGVDGDWVLDACALWREVSKLLVAYIAGRGVLLGST
jgi:hypothetical protein